MKKKLTFGKKKMVKKKKSRQSNDDDDSSDFEGKDCDPDADKDDDKKMKDFVNEIVKKNDNDVTWILQSL